METIEGSLKIVLCDMALKEDWNRAYAELIGVFTANADEIFARGQDLANQLKSEGKPDSYIDLRLAAYSVMYEREMQCLYATRKLEAEHYKG